MPRKPSRTWWTEQTAAGRHRVRFRVAGKKRSSPTFDYQWEAEDWAEAHLEVAASTSAPATVNHLHAAPVGPVLGEYAERYLHLRRTELEDQTRTKYAAAAAHFGPLAKLPMDAVDNDAAREWVNALVEAGVGAPTINTSLMVLRMLYTSAGIPDPSVGIKKRKMIVRRPPSLCEETEQLLLRACVDSTSATVAGAQRETLYDLARAANLSVATCSMVLNDRPGPSERTRARVLATAAEIGYQHRPTAAVDQALQTMVIVGLHAGLRWEEIAALPADCLSEGYLFVGQAVDRGRRIKTTKNEQTRYVPTMPIVEQHLAPLCAAARSRGGASALVFPSPGGRPLDYSASRRRLESAAKRAGLEPAPTWHALRHTFATRLSHKGTPLHIIAELLGHTDDRSVKIYAHKATDGLRRDFMMKAYGLVA